MNYDHDNLEAEFPIDLVALDSSMNLYYNTRTHKYQYYYCVDELNPEPRSPTGGRSELKAIPSKEIQQAAVRAVFVPGCLDRVWQQDSITRNMKNEHYTYDISRNDSGIDIDRTRDSTKHFQSTICAATCTFQERLDRQPSTNRYISQ